MTETAAAPDTGAERVKKTMPRPTRAKKPEAPTLPFYKHGKVYYHQHQEAKPFSPLNRRDAEAALYAEGLRPGAEKGDPGTMGRYLLETARERRVDYAGILAGHKMGLIENNGSKCLVTEDWKFPQPKEGDWSTIKRVALAVFGEDGIRLLRWIAQNARAQPM